LLQAEYSAAPDKSKFYYELRDKYNDNSRAAGPAAFIFLNRTCWNGLYRTNREGRFNVPYGAPKTERIAPSLEELLNASAALRQAELRVTSWSYTIARAQPGDFIFFDPPYYSDILAEDSKYGRRQFGLREHERLAHSLQALTRRGVDFILTNSGEKEMIALYSDYGLSVELVQSPRSINSKAERRGTPVPELIVSPQPATRAEEEFQLNAYGQSDSLPESP